MRITKMTVLTGALVIGLTGCTFSANFTVSADKIADLAASALEEQHPDLERPELDCGDDSVAIVVGEQVDCVLTDPSNGAELDAVVTITEVDGTNYSIDVQVADVPSIESENYTVPSSDLAESAAGALTEPLGFTPVITCDPADVPLVEGEQINCLATSSRDCAERRRRANRNPFLPPKARILGTFSAGTRSVSHTGQLMLDFSGAYF